MSTSKSSKNALQHGAYSSAVILPWENEQEFKDLYEELREEYFPRGQSEEEAIYDLACLYWKKRRLNVTFQLATRRDAQFNKLVEAGRRDGWSGIIDYIANKSHDSDTSIREALRPYLIAAKATYACVSKETEQMLAADTTSQEDQQKTADKLGDLIRMLKELQVSSAPIGLTLRMIENGDLDDRLSPYRVDIMEKELKTGGEIDKRIEKVMRRLVLTKEYKKLYGPKEIPALQSPAKILPTPPEQIQ